MVHIGVIGRSHFGVIRKSHIGDPGARACPANGHPERGSRPGSARLRI